MNHLAHFLLAPNTTDAVIGTLLADFHRGAIGVELPADVAQAIALHRAIDGETDRHPDLHTLKASFAPGHRRFAGLALDLYFDHCLARDWARHAHIPFDGFVEATYDRLTEGLVASFVPERMRSFATAMRDYDWLRSYGDFAGVEAALGRLNYTFRRRFQREVELRPLAGDLLRLREPCDTVFAALFPHLRRLAGSYGA